VRLLRICSKVSMGGERQVSVRVRGDRLQATDTCEEGMLGRERLRNGLRRSGYKKVRASATFRTGGGRGDWRESGEARGACGGPMPKLGGETASQGQDSN
jgi:hypothetical protein